MGKVFMLCIVLLGASYGIQNTYFASSKSLAITSENTSMLNIISALKSSAVYYNNRKTLPLGDVTSSYNQLPRHIKNVGASPTVPYLYCPYSQSVSIGAYLDWIFNPTFPYPPGYKEQYTNYIYENTFSFVNVGRESRYKVTTFNDTRTGGETYVRGSDTPPVTGLAAIIIAPNTPSNIPVCGDVAINDNGRYVLSGDSEGLGKVYVITHDELMADNSTQIHIAHNTETLIEALKAIEKRPEGHHLVSLTGETYVIGSNYNFEPEYLAKNGSVTLQGVRGVDLITGLQDLVKLRFSGVDVGVRNVNFRSGVQLAGEGINLSLKDVSVGAVELKGSVAHFNNVTITGNVLPDTSLYAEQSTVNVSGYFDLPVESIIDVYLLDSELNMNSSISNISISGFGDGAGMYLENSTVNFSDSTVHLLHSGSSSSVIRESIFYVDYTSKLSLINTVIDGSMLSEVTNAGFLNYGDFNSINSRLLMNGKVLSGITLDKGAKARFVDTQLGFASDSLPVLSLIHI